ncbi:MAG TPA: L,D-transpeptidase [Acidimicrobiales bacterium]|jgi:lipoprotein-anchoring transpeptidase ErfK/SrfK|nr:L,D-transpeptidase [Acidimicrobiales bacterium]
MRVRIVIACVVAALAIVAGVVLWPKGGKAATRVEVAPTTTTTTAPTTTTTTAPPHPFEAADAIVPEVNLYDAPGAAAATGSMPNPTVEHVPLAFLVKAHGPAGWLQVQIPRRPNGATAWIHAEDVGVRGVDNRIVIEREARRLTLYRGMSDEVLFQAAVATGAPQTPTPLGDFFVDIVVKITNTKGVYGPFQLSVAGFSDVLQRFEGGVGQIAIHGTNRPDLIGKFVSNGCIRLNNDDITALQPLAPVGTPVQIVA